MKLNDYLQELDSSKQDTPEELNDLLGTEREEDLTEAEQHTKYQAFFKSALKKFGVTSPNQLQGDKKKAFFNYVDKNWKGEKVSEAGSTEYRAFFKSALKKFGVTSPGQLKDDKKKAFFNYVDKNWKGEKVSEGVMGPARGMFDKLVHAAGESNIGQKVAQALVKRGAGGSMDVSHDVGAVGVVGAALLAAGAIYGAYKTYQAYFSKASKECVGLSGVDKKQCMLGHKRRALKLQIADLKGAAKQCKKTKNPEACNKKLTSKIASLGKKL